MSQPSNSNEPHGAIPALLQFLMFLSGMAVGTLDVGWTMPMSLVIGATLCAPIALVWAESAIRRVVPIGEGDDLPHLSGVVGALVATTTGALILSDPGQFSCSAFFFTPVAGLTLYNLIAFFLIGFRQLREGRTRHGWKRVEVLAVDDGIATLRRADELSLARVEAQLPLGIAYADIDEGPTAYRVPAIARLRDFESEQARHVRRALGKLAVVKLCSALMWAAVGLSPFMGAAIRELRSAW